MMCCVIIMFVCLFVNLVLYIVCGTDVSCSELFFFFSFVTLELETFTLWLLGWLVVAGHGLPKSCQIIVIDFCSFIFYPMLLFVFFNITVQ